MEHIAEFIQKLIDGIERALAAAPHQQRVNCFPVFVRDLIIQLLVSRVPLLGGSGTLKQLVGDPLKGGNDHNDAVPFCRAQDDMRDSSNALGIGD